MRIFSLRNFDPRDVWRSYHGKATPEIVPSPLETLKPKEAVEVPSPVVKRSMEEMAQPNKRKKTSNIKLKW